MKKLAIALCRVSTAEQKESNSLNRQEQNVLKTVEELDVEILDDGWWSGDVSSKAGTNVFRKDLKEMLNYCKENKRVKYLIVDEPDRFMRSVDEAFHFEVEFRMINVKVWYASNPELNTDDMTAKMMKFMKYFAAEGSNEERQRKSINGHVAAIREGRYTFAPKPGYMKGDKPGVHIPHHTEFKPLQKAFKEVASRISTPSEALKRLNDSDFTKYRTPWKIDKFIHSAKDAYFCGIVEMDKQVRARCENGQHEPMITKKEHEDILEVLSTRKTRHIRKQQYNPEFPMNKILVHDCVEGAKFTGSFQNNGHGKKYPKYRCRKCGKQYHRKEVHQSIAKVLKQFEYSDSQKRQFISALETVWHQKQQDNLNQIKVLQKRSDELREEKSRLYRELANTDDEFKEGLKEEIRKTEAKIKEIEAEKGKSNNLQEDLIEFVKFALSYTNILKEDWWQLDQQERLKCQQILFPSRIILNSSKKVGTIQICLLYRLAANKKELRIARNSLLVELEGIAPSSIRTSI